MKKRFVFLLPIIILVLQSEAVPVSRCFKRRSVSDGLKNSAAVFSGRAIAEEYRPVTSKEDRMPEGGEVLIIRFAVEHWWKGSGEEEVILYTGVTRYPDGYTRMFAEDFTFRVGEKYLVYAFRSGDSLKTDGCSRTTELEKAEEDLRELGEGKLPEKMEAFNFYIEPDKRVSFSASAGEASTFPYYDSCL